MTSNRRFAPGRYFRILTRVHPELKATVLYPATPQSVVPDRSSAVAETMSPGATVPNLIKQSAFNRKFYDETLEFNKVSVYPEASNFPVPLRASELSTSESVSAAKWNRPLLLPRKNPASLTDFTPLESGTAPLGGDESVPWKWTAPNWIFLQKDGKTPSNLSADLVPGACEWG